MNRHKQIKQQLALLNNRIADWQQQLGRDDALWILAMMGLVSGVLTGLIVVAFRHLFETPLDYLMPFGTGESFEDLPKWMHFALPASGGILLGIGLSLCNKANTFTGVAQVVHGANNLHGRLPWKNVVVQFFAGAVALGSGQALGREGPSVHLGAGISSIAGQRLGLPNNSLRVLIGCGTAAGIAASFNTPIAGIIFAMEVVLFEYTIMGFMPIMLAAVSGTIVARIFYGGAPAIELATGHHINLAELFIISGLAIFAAFASAALVWLTKFWLRQSAKPILLKLTFAGFLTGALALIAPEIMGGGHDTLKELLTQSALPPLLAVIIVAKLLSTSASAGLGMPAGVIGPSLFIGACIGALTFQLGLFFSPNIIGESSLYVMLGMAAMMAATLNAPLAALLALVELTYNPTVIFPGLLVICITNIIHRSVFKQPSIVSAILTNNGITLATDPVSLALQSRAARQVMEKNVIVIASNTKLTAININSEAPPKWLLVNDNDEWLAIKSEHIMELTSKDGTEGETGNDQTIVDISQTSAACELDEKATLKQAWNSLNKNKVNVLVIPYKDYANPHPKFGVLTRATIEHNVWQH
ncbi:MAG: CIC family chloride channel protein [Flavobacteriales bacterium]|jgi:CIC family chloride channel protein